MSDDRRRVLDLLAQGKVTVDEAAELLRALEAHGASRATGGDQQGEPRKPRWVRINVHHKAEGGTDQRDKDVNIRVPIAVVKSGMRLGAFIPVHARDEFSERLREKGFDVDFSKLDASSIDAMLSALGETDIEIESGRGQVRITCE
jgi:hypothetical protein